MKKLIKILLPIAVLLMTAVSASAYSQVNLPETMTLTEALGVSGANDVIKATVSEPVNNTYIELTDEEIEEFFETASDFELTREINATPFRGTIVNFYTDDGVKSYSLNSGVQIGMFGSVTYICYKADSNDASELLYLDEMLKDAEELKEGAEIHVNRDKDYLKLPKDEWAQTTVKEAASRCLVPYEFINQYTDDITREEFCVLLGNMIRVLGNYATLDDYMAEKGISYSTNGFSDCYDVDESVYMMNALGIVNGKGDGLFDPDGIITREEAATLIYRTAALFRYVYEDDTLYYDDTYKISQWARPYVAWVSDKFIMNGTEGNFLPQQTYTVQEAITTVNRLFKVLR